MQLNGSIPSRPLALSHSRPVLIAALFGLTVIAANLDAQIIRRPVQARTPTWWAAGSLGLFAASPIEDGSTDSRWQFGNAPQLRAAIEAPLQTSGTSTYGIAGSIARVPLTYSSGGTGTCSIPCTADGLASQLLLTFHNGGGANVLGFYQVFEGSAGITMFSHFRERATGAKIGPPGIDADPTLAIGYGFGYALSNVLHVELVQDFGLNIHQRTNLAGGAQTISGQYVTRIGIRYGLGG